MTIADLPPTKQPDAVTLLENAAADTTSTAVSLGARGVQLTLECEDPAAICDVTLYKVTAEGDVEVKKWTGLKAGVSVYAGNLEMVDLEGLPVKVAVSQISKGWVSVHARVTY
jgi:uncharacterized lipoprotein NlpE involved in copper resistance